MKSKKHSRRRFLKTLSTSAAMAAVAPYVKTSEASGICKRPPASDRITIGHIGVGNRGGGLLMSFLEIPNAQTVAVCDPFQYRMEHFAGVVDDAYSSKSDRSYLGCRSIPDYRLLLDRDDIDAVVIATPDQWHVPIALYAAQAGKAVYVEKPLGVTVKDNIRIREAVKATDTIFQYGTQQRSGRDFRFACELVRNGRIGELKTMHVWCPGMYAHEQFHEPGGSVTPLPIPDGFIYDMWLGPAPYSPYTSDRCTEWGSYYCYDNSLGFIAGWGAHPLDIAQWGNDSDDTVPVEYVGSGHIFEGGLYDVVDSWDFECLYENGVSMRFMSDDVARPIVEKYHPNYATHGTTFLGSEGWVSVDRAGIYAEPQSILTSTFNEDEIRLYRSDHHQQDFVDSVKAHTTPISNIGAAVQSDIISHICDIAIRLRRQKVKWNPVKEAFIGDAEANERLVRPMRAPWVY